MHEFKTTVLVRRSALVYTFVLSCGAWYLNVVALWQVFGLFQRRRRRLLPLGSAFVIE